MKSDMVRKQVLITQDEARKLKQLSFIQRKSETELVRTALEILFEKMETKRPDTGLNPLDNIVGLAGDLDIPKDLSANHDRYLYGGS